VTKTKATLMSECIFVSCCQVLAAWLVHAACACGTRCWSCCVPSLQELTAFTGQLHDWRSCESPSEYKDMPDHVYSFQVWGGDAWDGTGDGLVKAQRTRACWIACSHSRCELMMHGEKKATRQGPRTGGAAHATAVLLCYVT